MKKYYLDRKFDGFLNRLWIKKSLDNFLSTANFKDKIVLDLGCGESAYKMLIKDKNAIYYSADLEFCPNIDIILNLNQPLPFKDEISDCIILTEVLEHLHNPVFALSEIHRILVPGGRLFLTVPSFFRLHEIPNDFFRFTFFGLKYSLQRGGFTNFQIWTHGDEITTLVESLIIALHRSKLPKRITLFIIAIINSTVYFYEKRKKISSESEKNGIGLSALAAK